MISSVICLATAIYFEARGEPIDGQMAVAEVIINRTEHSLYPDTVCSVVRAPGQFAPQVRQDQPKISDEEAYLKALGISVIMLTEGTSNLTGGATHFYTGAKPSWARKFPLTAKVGRHNFHRQKDTANERG